MVAQESDDGDYQNIPFPQEDSVLQVKFSHVAISLSGVVLISYLFETDFY